jgi:hypothetical protein
MYLYLFSCGSTLQFWAFGPSMKISVSFRLLDLGQSAVLLGRAISSSQGPCVSAPGDCEEGEVGGMKGFGKENRSTRRKPAPTPLCPPQIPLARPAARTRAAAVGSQLVTAMAWPLTFTFTLLKYATPCLYSR